MPGGEIEVVLRTPLAHGDLKHHHDHRPSPAVAARLAVPPANSFHLSHGVDDESCRSRTVFMPTGQRAGSSGSLQQYCIILPMCSWQFGKKPAICGREPHSFDLRQGQIEAVVDGVIESQSNGCRRRSQRSRGPQRNGRLQDPIGNRTDTGLG